MDDHLEMLVEDSSSEDLDEDEVKNDQKENNKTADANEVSGHQLITNLEIF